MTRTARTKAPKRASRTASSKTTTTTAKKAPAKRAAAKTTPRARAAKKATPRAEASWIDKLNARVKPNARVTREADIRFGATDIQHYTLGNGLKVLLLEDHAAPVVSFHTWYRVGSRHEVEGKTGLAHLFEHLMFNETKHLPAGAFDRKLERAGAQTNAATWNDWTYYHEDVPAEQLPLVLELEADRMQHLVLRDPQVTSEKEVVANERRYRVDDDVDGSVNELLYQHAFEKHPYHHPTIGWMTDIEGFTTADCRAFYKTFYAPNNATVVAVGDVTAEKLLGLLQKHYGAIRAANLPAERRVTEPAQVRERRVAVKKPTPTARLAIGYRGPAFGDDDHAPLSVLSEALFGGRSARLFRELVTVKERALDVVGSVSSFRDPGLWEIYLTAREGVDAAALLADFDACVERVLREPVSDAERERAVARSELAFLQGMETVGGRAEQIGFFDVVLDDPAGAFTRLEAVRNVRTEDIARVAHAYLDAVRRTVIVVEPDGSAQAVEAEGEA